MQEFMRFYGWGMQAKLHMAIYAVALICTKSVVNLLQGNNTVSIWTMLQMLVACFVWAVLESFLFPANRELSREALTRRTIWWALSGNVLLVGGAFLFGWFSGIPVWAAVVLTVVLEMGLFAMWIGIHVALRKDTRALNQNLQQFQNGK